MFDRINGKKEKKSKNKKQMAEYKKNHLCYRSVRSNANDSEQIVGATQ